MKRAPGTGTVTKVRNGYWARLWVDGKRKSYGVHPTEDIAAGVLDAAIHARGERGGSAGSKLTFGTFAKQVLDLRETDGLRSVDSEKNRFKVHLENCSITDKAVDAVTSADIAALGREVLLRTAKDSRGKRRISRNTAKRVLGLVSVIFNEAVTQKLRDSNPCLGVRLRGRNEEEDDEETTEWLRGDEQETVLACEEIPEWGKLLMQFAWGTGLRQGEQWTLPLRNIHLANETGVCACGINKCRELVEHGPHVFVQYGSHKAGKTRSPKNKRTRRVPLFGHGLAAAKRWLEILPSYCAENINGLAFPGPSGARRPKGGPTRSVAVKQKDGTFKIEKRYLIGEWLEKARVRIVRWHDLRHTCASSLVSGSWGRKWTLDEVCKMLGHSSIKVTERYAHLCDTTLRDAAAATGYRGVTEVPPESDDPAVFTGRRGSDSNRRMTVLQGEGDRNKIKKIGPNFDLPSTTIAQKVLEAVATGDTAKALALAVTLAAAGVVTEDSTKEQTG